MDSIPPPIAIELAILHRRIRWLTAVCVFLGLGLVLTLVYRFLPVQPEVAASRFVLVDRQGHVRAQLGQWSDGTPVFQLDSREGRERLLLVASEDGSAGLRILDSTHVHRVFLEAGRDGWPRLILTGPEGAPRLILRTGTDGVGRVERRDASGASIEER